MTRLGRSVSLAVVAVAVTAVALCSAEEAEEAANEIPDSPYGKVAFNDQGYTFVAEQPGGTGSFAKVELLRALTDVKSRLKVLVRDKSIEI